MIASRTLLSGAILVAAVLSMHAGSASAGPNEDYEEATKRYGAGDVVSAMAPLRKAADANHAAAQAMLAQVLADAGSGDEAAVYFRKAADQGNADGQFGLGVMLAAGENVPKNVAEGRKLIVRAAEQEHKLAINELALAYINGGLDLPEQDRQGAEALRWIRVAADNGLIPAMEKLAAAYRNGDYGITADTKSAAQWDEKVRKALGLRQVRRNKRSNANEANAK